MKPAIMVHGGAWKIAEDTPAAHLDGTRAAAALGWEILSGGGTALDAVDAAVTLMEDDPTFDAGVGSVLNRIGEIELDAMIMDGRTLALGAVAACGASATRQAGAADHGGHGPACVGEGCGGSQSNATCACARRQLTVPREVERFRNAKAAGLPAGRLHAGPDGHGRRGGVDAAGGVAAATSTGGCLSCRGVGSPWPGRCVRGQPQRRGLRDGHGESIMRVLLSKGRTRSARHERTGGGLRRADAARARGGLRRADRGRLSRRVAFAYNTPHMAVAWVDERGEVRRGQRQVRAAHELRTRISSAAVAAALVALAASAVGCWTLLHRRSRRSGDRDRAAAGGADRGDRDANRHGGPTGYGGGHPADAGDAHGDTYCPAADDDDADLHAQPDGYAGEPRRWGRRLRAGRDGAG